MDLRNSIALICGLFLTGSAVAADAPSVQLALSFRPVQKGVDYESPKSSEYDQCRVEVEKTGKSSGWVVRGPAGQVLRRFSDTNGDNVVDHWRYYLHGLEVYRDVDSNFNNKVDQSRWLNTAGTRWGIDKNEDGRIDSWKVISAEETSREAVRAVAAGDEQALRALLISEEDLKTLGVDETLAQKLLASVSDPGRKLQQMLSGSKLISSKTHWMRFDGSAPGIIPADEGKAGQDLWVFENAMAIVETNDETGLVQLGEMVRVGDAWKLTQIPQPLEGNSVQVTAGGILMQPKLASATSPVGGVITPEMQKILTELQKLDENSPSPSAGRTEFTRYNSRRADLLQQLIDLAGTEEGRTPWRKQLVDGLATAVQTGDFPDGLQRLNTIEQDVRRAGDKTDMLPYVSYRRLLAEYTVKMQRAEAGQQPDVQTWWLAELKQFAEEYPRSEDAPEALLQLAISQEFTGNLDAARQWYGKLVTDYGDSSAAHRAAGALRRLDLKGKRLTFSGDGLKGGTVDVGSFRGHVLLVLFWATWCKPCTEDLPQLQALYEQYHDRGFEVLGVNLDATAQPVEPYLNRHRVTWPQIYQPGGLDSEPAVRFGIISLPTMFLVDADGTVVSRNVSVDELKSRLPELLSKK